nr:glycosyltransferase family 4 protein [uncultured Prevotella sp.]
MKNICFTIRNIDCGGGTERVGLRLANALAEYGYNVWMVDYDSKHHKPFFETHPKLKLWTILRHGGFERKMRWHFWYGAWKLRRFLKKNKIDVVIDIDTFNANWTAKAIRGLGIKWISWDHFDYEYTKGWKRQEALQLVKQDAYALVLITKALRKTYLEKTDFSSSFLRQIYNPLSFEVDHALNHQGQKKVVAMGRIAPQKGFDLLLKSWLLVEKEVKDWTLQIVCGYGDYEALEREAKEMGCKNVVCTGPTSDVPGVMKDAAIFAFSSRFEGFGLVLTEANACSVPAVSYNCPVGPSEIVTDGVDGFLVEPENVTQFAEKLMELMKDDKLRAEMGVKAYESSKRFAMDKILNEWVELIEE